MTANNVIQAAYVNFKYITSRNVCQVVLEVPMEQGTVIHDLLGPPLPAKANWVALAPLGGLDDADMEPERKPDPAEKPRQSWSEMPRSKQAAIRCNEPAFQKWIKTQLSWGKAVTTQDGDITQHPTTADLVRHLCQVASRSELDQNHPGAGHWDDLDAQYMVDTGQIAERTR